MKTSTTSKTAVPTLAQTAVFAWAHWRQRLQRAAMLCLAVLFTATVAQAATAPAQQPMLSGATGTNPNVILNFDNSGSMLEPFLDIYPYTNSGTKKTGATEYYNWTCNGSGLTGPFRDNQGQYYCISTSANISCPNGFTGPFGTAPNQYCQRKDPVYSCPSGYTGPTSDSNGNPICSQTRYNSTCSDPTYSPSPASAPTTCSKTTVTYSCPSGYSGPTVSGGSSICTPTTPTITYSCDWQHSLNSSTSPPRCYQYQCASGWTLGKRSGSANCYSYNWWGIKVWDSTQLFPSTTSYVAATATSSYPTIAATSSSSTSTNAALLQSSPYIYTQAATTTYVTNNYNNAQPLVLNTPYYGTKPYTSGYVLANSRTTYGTPAVNITGGTYYAMRSAQVNPLYYDPNKTYSPRVNYTGTGLYEPLPTGFVKDAGTESDYIATNNSISSYSFDTGNYYPNLSVVASPANTDSFVTVVCDGYNGADTSSSSCTIHNLATNVQTITPLTTVVNLPIGNARTDCGTVPATTCTGAAERQNIRNWYQYYRRRTDILATSVGFAISKAKYSNKMRVGFFNIDINQNPSQPSSWSGAYGVTTTGSASPANTFFSTNKGVRPFTLGVSTQNTTYTKPIYDWLYGQGVVTAGGTPLPNAVYQVGKYYQSAEPWYSDPTDSTSSILACRRAYNIMFSDGAWNSGARTTSPVPYDQTGLAPTSPSGASVTLSPAFTYSYQGDATNPSAYTPYPDAPASNGDSGSLAALTSQYYWGWDLQPTIANQVVTRAGEPTSWQNMKTYTIGYGISPGDKLTTQAIADWKRNFPRLGYQAAAVPDWNDSNSQIGDGATGNINDFIHAGYTGGGASYSVFSADDIQRAFDIVLSDVVSASGSDAGVAVSGASSSVSTLQGSLKYTVDYKTVDNTGDVKAWKLDANGNNATVAPQWSAKTLMPLPAARNLSTLSSLPLSSGPVILGQSTRLDSLPADIQTPLLTGAGGTGSLATDSSFIRYLRGDDGITDPTGNLYRSRASMIAASVNVPPVFVGGRLNMGYTLPLSTVSGGSAYASYITDKGQTPGTLYAPTNDGQIHVLNAADDTAIPAQSIQNASGKVVQPGTELWSYLVRDSLPMMQAYANPAYSFQYVLDGPINEADIYDSTGASPIWKQMLFGSMGRAAKGGIYGLYAPINKVAGNQNRIPDQNGYKWDVSPTNMGYVTNATVTGQTPDGSWVVLVNSGHYAGTGSAGLFVLNALTGATIQYIPLPTGYAFGRGLGGVTAIRDATRHIVGAYAGDDGGNLWRFDLSSTDNTKWGVSYNKPLFTTAANQPIYVAPAWQVHPGDGQALPSGCVNGRPTTDSSGNPITQQCGAIVVFGTGMLMDSDDTLNNTVQTIYGIWDKTPIGQPNTLTYQAVTQANLQQQSILPTTGLAGAGTNATNTYYQVTSNPVDWTTKRGWYLNLSALPNSTGERVIGDVFNLGSNVFVSSVVPDTGTTTVPETCTVKASPPNFLYGLDALTGGLKRAFDQNSDGRPDLFSVVYIPGGGFTRGSVITQSTGVGSGSNIGMGTPTEGAPDLSVQNKCTGGQGYDTGVSGSTQVFDGCAAGWTRSWRQILVPPIF